MDWGIPTLLEAADPESAASLCRELGFDFVELSMDLPEYQSFDIPWLQSVASRYQIYYTIHLEGFMDLCGFNPRVTDAYLQTLLEVIEVAKRLNVPTLNIHLQRGDHFTLPDKKVYLYELYLHHYLSRLSEAIAPCEKAAAGAKIQICIENTNGYNLSFLQKGMALLLKSPLFGLTYDIGHDHGVGEVDKPFILDHQNRLKHFHIHDALGGKSHLPLGIGELDIPWYVALAEKNHCRAVLEVKTAAALADSVEWLKQHELLHKKNRG
ncbi:sugar phosphate isomerase/epimerase family protein [Acutalibacter intestini]|uniref:sugar phosphate isomerase/epimerase family protein n=1 Tax=Acutalibacter intestini TaxID=3093659 RepID=UPI002AC8C7DB|nr:sugar phosphate isomerase/epimerase family protein [Acutalibacter sp. M00204]